MPVRYENGKLMKLIGVKIVHRGAKKEIFMRCYASLIPDYYICYSIEGWQKC
jgi:hypothetical protein